MTRTAPAVPALRGYRRPTPLSGVERVMLLILTLTVASTCLLTSAGQGVEAGHKPWGRNSVLHVITDLLNLGHHYPTARGTEIKWFTLTLGAAAALVCAVSAWFLRTRREPDEFAVRAAPPASADQASSSAPATVQERPFAWLRGMSPTSAAQVALVLFVGWSAFSALWSPWAEASLYEAMRLGIGVLFAVAIAHGVSVRGLRHGVMWLAGVLAVMAVVGVWYYYERNPIQRLKYPIGNPIFFAACLLPGLTLLGGWAAGEVLAWQKRDPRAPAQAPYLKWGAAVLGLVAMAWAFVLADSRGPGLGLALGLLTATLLVGSRQTRIVLSIGTVVATIMFFSLGLWPVSWLLSRPDTVRARLYAWKYALELFLSRPDIGRGQGAYLLLAQEKSRADAERDPLAFPAELLGHAHNEWLEILADLGAFGLALMLTAIGVTLWAALLAWRRTPAVRDRAVLFGLLAGFLAMVFESLSDVALRMPGLPAVFFATWGLLWAMSRGSGAAASPVTRPAAVRVAGLVAGIAGGWLVLTAGTYDWHGALSEPLVARYATQLQWDKALAASQEAGKHRLGIEPRLSALYQATRVTRDAAAHRIRQLQEMLQRASLEPQPGETAPDPAAIMRIAHEDAQAFEKYFELGLQQGNMLLDYCPAYPDVAEFMSDLWLLRAQIASVRLQSGPLPLAPLETDPMEAARQALEREYAIDRLDAELGLRLLELSGDRPMLQRLDLLRIPMRAGPIHPGVEPALMELMRERDFGPAIDALLAAAGPAATGTTPWPDPYSPESLRLVALANKRRGAFEESAAMAGRAAELLDQIRDRFPISASFAMNDQAEYLLLGDTARPERALAAFREGLRLWPESFRPQERARFERAEVIYLLATGDEAAARQLLTRLLGSGGTAEGLNQSLGFAYVELCQRFMLLRPEGRPGRFKEWLQQALMLAANQPEPLMIAATVMLEEKQDAIAIENLTTLEQVLQHPPQMAAFVRSLMARFPDSSLLRAFAAQRLPELAATQPATTGPFPATMAAPLREDPPGLPPTIE